MTEMVANEVYTIADPDEANRLEQCEECRYWFPYEEMSYHTETNTWTCVDCTPVWYTW